MNYIAKEFRALNIQLDANKLLRIEKLMVTFELRKEHPSALNSNLLGVHPIAFTDSDRSEFFNIFGYTESDIVRVIKDIPTINKDFNVSSDAFNVFALWLLHIGYTQLTHDNTELCPRFTFM